MGAGLKERYTLYLRLPIKIVDEHQILELHPNISVVHLPRQAERLMGPPEDVEEDEDFDVDRVPDIEDDDPDYIFENNDGYDSDDSREFEDVVDNFELRVFRADDDDDNEEDEDLDYVTFPVSENNTMDTIETTNKTTNQESSNSSSSEHEVATEEERWD